MHYAPERAPAAVAAPASDDRVLERFLALQVSANPRTLELAREALERLGRRGEGSDAEHDRSRALAESLARGLAWLAAAPVPDGLRDRDEALERKDRARETLRLVTEGPPIAFQWCFGEAWARLHESSSATPDPPVR
jgi:hypothetical protein